MATSFEVVIGYLYLEKKERLNEILPNILGLEGVLHMENWTEETANIIFEKIEPETEETPDGEEDTSDSDDATSEDGETTSDTGETTQDGEVESPENDDDTPNDEDDAQN